MSCWIFAETFELFELLGRLADGWVRVTLAPKSSVGYNPACERPVKARACFTLANAAFRFWLCAIAACSNLVNSASLNSNHHSPLGMLSLGAAGRQPSCQVTGSSTAGFW